MGGRAPRRGHTLRRARHLRRLPGQRMTPDQLLIATPIYGRPTDATVAYGYHQAVRRLERGGAVVLGPEIAGSVDLVKARMRMVAWALQRPNWKWILWWDSDVVPEDHNIVPRMLATAIRNEWDVLGAPYPRKTIPA